MSTLVHRYDMITLVQIDHDDRTVRTVWIDSSEQTDWVEIEQMDRPV